MSQKFDLISALIAKTNARVLSQQEAAFINLILSKTAFFLLLDKFLNKYTNFYKPNNSAKVFFNINYFNLS